MGPSWLKSEKFTVLTRVLKGLQLSYAQAPAPIEFYYLSVGCKPNNIGLGKSLKRGGHSTTLLIKSFE